MTARAPLVPDYGIALFVAVDGALLEVAPTPDGVRVPAALRNTLTLAAEREGGALALISGRTLEQIDQLFRPCRFAASCLHGAQRRSSDGRLSAPFDGAARLDPSRLRLSNLLAQHRGLLLEDKGIALAMHYGRVIHLEATIRSAVQAEVDKLGRDFTLREGRSVFEIVPSTHSTSVAIESFMAEEPFLHRFPVVVGDAAGGAEEFRVVNALGGISISVGSRTHPLARHGFPSVSAVIGWLRERNLAAPRSAASTSAHPRSTR